MSTTKTYTNLQPAARKFRGVRWQPRDLNQYTAEVRPGRSVRIHGTIFDWWGREEVDQTWHVGDLARRPIPILQQAHPEQRSGRIASIGPKTVTLTVGNRQVRLDLWQFANANAYRER